MKPTLTLFDALVREPLMKQARIVHLPTHGLLNDFKGLGLPEAIARTTDVLLPH